VSRLAWMRGGAWKKKESRLPDSRRGGLQKVLERECSGHGKRGRDPIPFKGKVVRRDIGSDSIRGPRRQPRGRGVAPKIRHSGPFSVPGSLRHS